MLHNSVLVYKRYLEQNRLVFGFIVGERSGGSPVIAAVIACEPIRAMPLSSSETRAQSP